MIAPLIRPALASPRSDLAVGTYGGRVIAWAKRRLGFDLGAWQQYAVKRMLEYDASGNLLAREVLLSVGRQNGKSVIVRSVVGWLLDEGYKLPAFSDYRHMMLAAHDANQARIPYDLIRRDIISYADISAYGHSARRSAGKSVARATMYTGIELNGIVVGVASNRADSGRGHSNGLIAFDEVLTQRDFGMHEVLAPSLSAIRNSQLLMTSTAGYADSVLLRSYYDRLYRQATGAEQHDPSYLALWWMADDDDIGLDYEQLLKANPGLNDGRLSRRAIASEYAILPKGSWTRERLNRWADERVDAPFSLEAWGACRVSEPLLPGFVDGGYVIAVDVTSNWTEGTITYSAMRKDNRVGVEIHRHLESRVEMPLKASDFINEITKLTRRIRVDSIVYVASSALAPALERHAVESSLPYLALQGPQVMKACADFAEAVTSQRIAHDDPYLDGQIAGAQRRFIGKDGAWRWAISDKPATGIVTATLGTMFAARSATPVQIFL